MKLIGFILSFIVLLCVLVGGMGVYLANQPLSSESTEKILEVKKGEAAPSLLLRLKSEGLLQSERAYMTLFWTGKLTRAWGRLKAGEYKISTSMSSLEVLKVLTSGLSVYYPVTVHEGDNIYQVAGTIKAKGLEIADEFLSLCESPKRLEGYLFPDTYHVTKIQSAADVIREMKKRFDSVWRPEWTKRAKELGLTQHQVVTLASIIEKETGAPHERKLISSVFHNRLRKKMRLQSDPTTIYGIWKSYNGNITRAHLKQETPYNTYTIPGLPVGPIGNPGEESLEAALYPATSEFLYFVSMNDGTHVFNSTLEGHNKAVRDYQLNRRAREGKSWRDLKKGNAQ